MHDAYKMQIISKSWGYERWICNSSSYCGKLLVFMQGLACSAHYHKLKNEHFSLEDGEIEVRFTDDLVGFEQKRKTAEYPHDLIWTMDKCIMQPGDNFYVPPGRVHMMIAHKNSKLYEFSTEHFEEDSYRLIKGSP